MIISKGLEDRDRMLTGKLRFVVPYWLENGKVPFVFESKDPQLATVNSFINEIILTLIKIDLYRYLLLCILLSHFVLFNLTLL